MRSTVIIRCILNAIRTALFVSTKYNVVIGRSQCHTWNSLSTLGIQIGKIIVSGRLTILGQINHLSATVVNINVDGADVPRFLVNTYL